MWKLPKHKVEYQKEVKEQDKQYVIPVDTTIQALAGNHQNYVPYYSGDMQDISNLSLMDIAQLSKSTSENIEFNKNKLNEIDLEYQKTQIQNPALLNEDGTLKEHI